MNPNELPFRADHVGSLLRPGELLQARGEQQAGRISPEELRRVEDAAIRDVVHVRQRVGWVERSETHRCRRVIAMSFALLNPY